MGLDSSRVLRIGIVWRGQVIAERVLERRTEVTVGTRPDATVSLNAKEYPQFPALVTLAVLHQGAYHLVLPSDPSHTISLRGGPAGSQGVSKDAVVQVKGQRAVPIESYTGGSVHLGEIILMFQFVRGDAVPTVTREETVLRIGLVHEDRLLSDQVFRGDKSIVIGTGARHSIALPDVEYRGKPASFAKHGATSFKVRLPKDCDLRLALENAPPMDVAQGTAAKVVRVQGDEIEFELPVRARGRARLGPYTLLFQVVKQTLTVPTMPRKSLVAQMAGPLMADATWTLSFLIAIALIGSIVGQAVLFHRTTGRFLGKTEADEALSSTTYEVLIEEKEEEPPEEEKKEETEILSEQAKKAQEQEKKQDEQRKPAKVEKPQATGKTLDPVERTRQAREVVSKRTIAGALLGKGGAATKLFAAGGDEEGGEVIAKTFGGGGGDGDGEGPGTALKLAGGGTSGGGTMEKVAGGNKGGFKREQAATKVTDKKVEAKVNIRLSAGEMGGSGESKTDVAKVISRKNSAVQRCYEKALRDNPDEGGKVKVTFTVGTAGTVTEVTVSGASGPFSDCIKSTFSRIRGLPLLASPQSFHQSYVFSKN